MKSKRLRKGPFNWNLTPIRMDRTPGERLLRVSVIGSFHPIEFNSIGGTHGTYSFGVPEFRRVSRVLGCGQETSKERAKVQHTVSSCRRRYRRPPQKNRDSCEQAATIGRPFPEASEPRTSQYHLPVARCLERGDSLGRRMVQSANDANGRMSGMLCPHEWHRWWTMRDVVEQRWIVTVDGTIVQVNYADVADYFDLQATHDPGSEASLAGSPVDQLRTPSTPEREVTQSPRMVVTWTDDQTKFMLDAYRKYMDKVGPLQKFKNKKQLWTKISQEMLIDLGVEFTPSQIENRWKNVLKRTKNASKNNRTSGSTIIRTPFDSEMAQIAAMDDSIEPEVIMTPTTIRRKAPVSLSSPLHIFPAKRRLLDQENQEEPQPTTSKAATCIEPNNTDPPPESRQRKAKFLDAYLIECENRQIRAEDKQKRHVEKMEKIDKLTDVFTIIANNMANR